jgi:hypothetical protein
MNVNENEEDYTLNINSAISKKVIFEMNSERAKKRMLQMKKRKEMLNETDSLKYEKSTFSSTVTPLQNEDSEAHYLPHSFFFDESNANFTKSPIANRKFLEDIQRWTNMTLERDGMIVENDIFHASGAKKTVSGQTTVFYYRNPDGTTNHISFGIEDNTVAAQRFRDGLEPVFLVQLKYDDGRSPEVIDPKRLANLNWFLC